MIEKIYGNGFALKTFESVFSSGRLPHSFLIYGEKGLGKKMLAERLAMAILCENSSSGTPCGECRSCRNALKHVHPDLIRPEQSGKLNTYTAETCRNVCSDAFVAPNDGDAKVYIFADCNSIQLTAQNSLLKIIEEPPDPVYFIFTADSKDRLLPTIISRVTSIAASPCTPDECAGALALRGFESSDISAAVDAFGGNVGKCTEYINDPQLREVIGLTKRAADSIINSDEYELLKVFSSAELKDRYVCVRFLEMLDRIIRDGVVFKYSKKATAFGCCAKASERLSEKLSVKTADKIHQALGKAAEDVSANVNQSLVMSALCGEIISS